MKSSNAPVVWDSKGAGGADGALLSWLMGVGCGVCGEVTGTEVTGMEVTGTEVTGTEKPNSDIRGGEYGVHGGRLP